MMRKQSIKISFYGLVFAVLCAVSAPVRAAEEVQYFTRLPDVPIVTGFAEPAEKPVVFDAPDGRYVEVYAVGPADRAGDVMPYYRQTLPEMGWRKLDNKGDYIRDGERLEISAYEQGSSAVIKMMLIPQ